jgi:hypothetical protein
MKALFVLERKQLILREVQLLREIAKCAVQRGRMSRIRNARTAHRLSREIASAIPEDAQLALGLLAAE